MERFKGLSDVTQLFIDHFIRIAGLTKDSPVPFGTLFISFMLASKVIAQTFVKSGLITEEQLVKLNEELDGVVKTASCKEQVDQVIEAIKREEKEDVGSGSSKDE